MVRARLHLLPLMLGALAPPGPAGAEPGDGNLLRNGSFEAGDFRPDAAAVMSLPPGATSIAGWTVLGDTTSWLSSDGPWRLTASDGARFLDLTDYGHGPPFGGVAQTVPTVPGVRYELTFDLGSSADYGAFAGLRVEAAGQAHQVFAENPGVADLWQRQRLVFTAKTDLTEFRFLGIEGGDYIGLDNLHLRALGPARLSQLCSEEDCAAAPRVY